MGEDEAFGGCCERGLGVTGIFEGSYIAGVQRR